MEAEAGAGRAKAVAEARGGDGRPEEGPGGEEMGLQLKVEPEGGALEVKLELAGGVEAKLEWEGLRIKVEVVEEPPEGGEGGPEALQLKQEVMEEVEVKQEVVEVKQEVQVKQEVMDEVEVKQEVIEQVEVKQEPLDEVEVKQEPLDEVEVKQEPLDPGQIKEEPLDEVEVKQEAVEGVEIKEEPVDAADVKRECVHEADVKPEARGGVEVKQEGGRAGPLDRKQALVAGLEALREVVGRMRAREELLHWAGVPVKKEEEEEGLGAEEDTKVGVKMEVKEEEAAGEPEVKLEVKEEEDGMEVKAEAQGVEMKKEEVKEEAPQGPEVKEEQAQGPRRPGNAEPKEEPGSPGEPPAGRKRKLAMSSCETCGTEEAKYRCPRCMKCSCSLACVKKHKTELTCNGIREKTAFVSLKQFTEINLLSDYRFLEDVGRSADYIARDIFLKRPSTNRILNYMKNRARRHNIDLRILPIGFTKRRENSTMFDRKEQRFYWHLKLLFPQSRAEYIEKGVPGDKKLHEILRTYIDPEKSDPVIRQRLKAYVLSESGIQILMKIENMQHNLVRYYELDPCKSLIDNLKNKVVIEYPTLHVVLKGSKNDMVILGQERNESMKSFGSENPAFCSEEEGEI